jgi:hypothetical protein
MTSGPTIADVEIDYRAYDEPMIAGYYNGRAILHHGILRAKWRSPEGVLLASMMSVRSEPAAEDIDTYAEPLVESLAERYESETTTTPGAVPSEGRGQ